LEVDVPGVGPLAAKEMRSGLTAKQKATCLTAANYLREVADAIEAGKKLGVVFAVADDEKVSSFLTGSRGSIAMAADALFTRMLEVAGIGKPEH
jgi:hypothetical protein